MKYLKNKIPGEENSYRIIFFLRFNILKNKKMYMKNCIRSLLSNKVWKSSKNFFIYNDSNILKSLWKLDSRKIQTILSNLFSISNIKLRFSD